MKNKQCLYCPQSFFNNNMHALHMKNDHPEVRAFFCEICSDEFATIYFLRKHRQEAHLPKNSPKCETCGQAFLSMELLKAHKLKHLPRDARQFKCGQCSKKFFEAKRLRVHTLRFHQRKEGPFKCAICPRSYDTKRKLLRHILEHVQDDIYAIKHGYGTTQIAARKNNQQFCFQKRIRALEVRVLRENFQEHGSTAGAHARVSSRIQGDDLWLVW
jgi:uncharacterized Zn-finger protein